MKTETQVITDFVSAIAAMPGTSRRRLGQRMGEVGKLIESGQYLLLTDMLGDLFSNPPATLEGQLHESVSTSAPYGYCPICAAPGVSRERRPNGNDRCKNGHTYLSANAQGKL